MLKCATILNRKHVDKMNVKTQKKILFLLNRLLGIKYGEERNLGKYIPHIETVPTVKRNDVIEYELFSTIDPKDLLGRNGASG